MLDLAYQTVGWIGAILFSICTIPQAWETWKTHKVEGISLTYWLMLLFGEYLMLSYIAYEDILNSTMHIPLYFNYSSNFILILYMVYAKVLYQQENL